MGSYKMYIFKSIAILPISIAASEPIEVFIVSAQESHAQIHSAPRPPINFLKDQGRVLAGGWVPNAKTHNISWHIETFHPATSTQSTNEYIVLIPAGEGDCDSLTNVAHLLSSSGPHHVLTFDMPGFSRTTAPPEAYANVTPQLLAKQIVGLLDSLSIHRATFFGCSSGGCATLALCALYPTRVKCGLVHEVPLDCSDALASLKSLSDEQVQVACRALFVDRFIEQEANDGPKKWDALGDEYHARLGKNFVTWVRSYVNSLEAPTGELTRVPANLQQRPIFWTVGSLNPGAEVGEGFWKSNFEVTSAAGMKVDVERLRCLHFPSVTVPEELVGWIKECDAKVKD